METGSNDQGHQHLTLLPRVKTVGEGGSGTGGDELSVVVQIHPLESEICGDLEPPQPYWLPPLVSFIFIVDCLLVAIRGFSPQGVST